jgi:hypothetical protein
MRIASHHMRHNALTKLLWMRFAHIDRLCLFPNKESRFKPNGNPESKQTQSALRDHPLLRRDCLQVEFDTFTLFVCHFKAP